MDSNVNIGIWPGWTVIKEIGRGSFGTVYEIGKDNYGVLDKAALKKITIPQNSSSYDELYSEGYDEKSITDRYKQFQEEIVREYQLMAQLRGNHNIVYCDDLHCVQHEDGIGWDIYMKMELLTPLTKAFKTPVDEDEVVRLGIDICNALVSCKKKKVIHRDIKPQNIFVSEEGTYKLGDFGIAKTAEQMATGTKTGTFKYMAPEVYNNRPYDASCDVYSLGLVLYWMLNERRGPFLPLPPTIPTATEDNDALVRRMSGEVLPEPLNGSAALKRIVMKACEHSQEKRYASAEEMYYDLKRLSGDMVSVSEEPEKAIFESAEEEYQSDETIGVFGAWAEQEEQEEKEEKEIPTPEIPKETTEKGNFDVQQELALVASQMSLGCDVECYVPQTEEWVRVNIPAGKKAGGTITVKGKGKTNPKTGERGDLYLLLSLFVYSQTQHQNNRWSKMKDAELLAYAMGYGASGEKLVEGMKNGGIGFVVLTVGCILGVTIPPIGFAAIGIAIWLFCKPSNAKKNKKAAIEEWNKRYPNAKR